MTLSKILKLFNHYKKYYDFKLAKVSYKELEEKINHQGEMFPDE